jgi:transcriptional regulator with XRE-family HTH domain
LEEVQPMTVAGSLLRTARQSRRVSTRALAKAAHVSQPGITALETGREDATAARLDRLLAPLGFQLMALPTRLRPASRAAADVYACLANGDTRTAFREILQLAADLQLADPAIRVALAVTPPATTGDLRYDALLASVVDVLLTRARLPRPTWLDEPGWALADPWDVEPVDALRAAARALTPPAARRHGVYLDPAELEIV